jgi:hypothetical protein
MFFPPPAAGVVLGRFEGGAGASSVEVERARFCIRASLSASIWAREGRAEEEIVEMEEDEEGIVLEGGAGWAGAEGEGMDDEIDAGIDLYVEFERSGKESDGVAEEDDLEVEGIGRTDAKLKRGGARGWSCRAAAAAAAEDVEDEAEHTDIAEGLSDEETISPAPSEADPLGSSSAVRVPPLALSFISLSLSSLLLSETAWFSCS